MTDGNTYAINKHLDELEEFDALQEVTAELEQAEAENEKYYDAWLDAQAEIIELELAVRYEADLAQMALDARKELEAKLAKAVDLLEEIEVRLATISGFFPDTFPRKEIKATLAELKGQDDE